MVISKKASKMRLNKRIVRSKDLGLSEAILKLFPKASRMGSQEPSRWGTVEARRVYASDQSEHLDVTSYNVYR